MEISKGKKEMVVVTCHHHPDYFWDIDYFEQWQCDCSIYLYPVLRPDEHEPD